MPYADKEKQQEYAKQYRLRNKKKILEYRKWYLKYHPEKKRASDKKAHFKRAEHYKETARKRYLKNPEYRKQKSAEYRDSHPWANFYYNAHQRCKNRDHRSFSYYGGRGIEFLLTMDDVEVLWLRDKAYKLTRPSLDRKNSNGNYVLKNCRFIELVENIGRR